MTLVQLRHFLSIAETGSFTRSARATFLTQSALSRSLRALEDELGQPLFDRIGRRSELTPFGRSLLERARQLVHDADALAAAGRGATGAAAERLRVGMGSGPGALLTPALLQRAARPGAGLRIDIQHGDVPRLVEALRRRELDALVVEVRSFPPLPGLRIEPVVALRGAFMCRRGHPLARRRRPLRFEDLLAYPIASTPLGDHVVRALVDVYGPAAHPDLCLSLRCTELAPLVEATRHSDAVLIAIRAAAPDLAELRVGPSGTGGAHFGLVTLARRTEPAAVAQLREAITQHLREDAAPTSARSSAT